MNSKSYRVIDAFGFYRTDVQIEVTQDEEGKSTERIIGYILKEDETLLDAPLLCFKPYAGAEGLVRQRWNGKTWVEGATLEELSVWESENPALPPMPPTETEKLQEENRLLRAQISAESDRTDFIEDCIAEMAAQVYV